MLLARRSSGPAPADSGHQFSQARKLKWLQTYSAGVEAYRWNEFSDSNVVLGQLPYRVGPNIADHAISLLLAEG